MKVRDFEIRSYEDAQRLPGGQLSRRVCNNTTLRRHGENVCVRLHGHDIVQWTPTSICLWSGGWRSVTTKDRINRCIPTRFHLYQHKGTWYVEELDVHRCNVLFEEGMDLLTAFSQASPEE
jgi:hypothetical protein